MKAWTSYPLDQYTLVFEVDVLAFDGDKYVLVRHGSLLYSMKAGYLKADNKCKKNIPDEDFKKIPVRCFFNDPDIISA